MSGSIHFRGVNGALVFYNLQTNEDVLTIAPDGTITAPGLSGVSGESILHQATVPLTDAQIKALPSVQQEIVAAPGANRVLVYVSSAVQVDATAGAYTNEGSLGLELLYASGVTITDATAPNDNATYFAAADVWRLQLHPKEEAGETLSEFADTAIVASYETNVGDLLGGHADNTLTITVAYLVWNTLTGEFE